MPHTMLQENDAFEPLFSISALGGQCPKSDANDFTFNMPSTTLQRQIVKSESADGLYYNICRAPAEENQRPADLAVIDRANSEEEEEEEEHSSPETARVKRPMNAFMVWAKEERARLSAERTHKHNADLSRLLGQRWREMTDSEKAPYRKEAQQLAQRHKREHPEYRYRPRRRQSTERKVRGRRINSEDLSRVKAAFTPEQLSAYMARGGLKREQRSQSATSLASLASSGSASSNSVHNTSWDDLRFLTEPGEAETMTLIPHRESFSNPSIDILMRKMDRTPSPPRNLPSCVNDRQQQAQYPPLLLLDSNRGQDWCAVQNNGAPLSPCSSLNYSARQPMSPTTPTGCSTPSLQPPPLIEASPNSHPSLLPPLQTANNLPITPTIEGSKNRADGDPPLFNSWLPLNPW